MLLTDTHLIAPLTGFWIERLLVESQMQRVYQTAISIHQPGVVFILGDLFDDGQYVNNSIDDKYFEEYLSRFFEIFKTPPHIKQYCLVGNQSITDWDSSIEVNFRVKFSLKCFTLIFFFTF